eukprot:TRINITY_DN3619_c0_g1_i1.p1 TRINITY_DN3619_c0_g1~~TRINITY_DN3619_c0_g1_i1.p1  ORF type:complete len:196 (-),score=75.00 TRINITY_DN3619_c0_g1_i1:243-767(-)
MAAFRDAFLKLDTSMSASDVMAKRQELSEQAGVPEPEDQPPEGAVFLTEDLYLSSNSLGNNSREPLTEEEINNRIAQIQQLGLNYQEADPGLPGDVDCPYPEESMLDKIKEKVPELKSLAGEVARPPYTDLYDKQALAETLALVAEKTQYDEGALNSLADDYKTKLRSSTQNDD